MRALVSIGNYEFPTPSEYKGTASTLVDSARNTQGYVVGAVIRDDVAKVEMVWNYLTAEQWSGMLKLFTEKYGGEFYRNVTFYDQVSNTWVTRKMYISDRTSTGAFILDDSGKPKGWVKPKFSLVEV